MDPILGALLLGYLLKNGFALAMELPYLMRRQTSPYMQLRMAREKRRAEAAGRRPATGWAGTGRHAARDFFAGLWHDSWDGASSTRQKIRARRADRLADGTHWAQRTGRGLRTAGRVAGAAGVAIAAAAGTAWRAGRTRIRSTDPTVTADSASGPQTPVSDAAYSRLQQLRDSGYDGPVDSEGYPVDSLSPTANRIDPADYDTEFETTSGGLLAVPAAATHPCRSGCGGMYRPYGLISVDEGDGGAIVPVRCDGCGLESFHGWALSDADYEAQFGHPFGEAPECWNDDCVDEACDGEHHTDVSGETWTEYADLSYTRGLDDDLAEPSLDPRDDPFAAASENPFIERNTAMPAGTAPTGETTNITSALDFAKSMAENATAAATSVETAMATMQAEEVTGRPIELLGSAHEQLTTLAGTFTDVEKELEQHLSIGEAYASVGNDAGSKDFNTLD